MFRRQHICPSVCSLLLKLMLTLYKMRPSQKAEPKPGWGGVARNLDKVSVTLMTSERDIFFKLHGLENTLKQAEVDLYGDFWLRIDRDCDHREETMVMWFLKCEPQPDVYLEFLHAASAGDCWTLLLHVLALFLGCLLSLLLQHRLADLQQQTLQVTGPHGVKVLFVCFFKTIMLLSQLRIS